LARIEEAAPQSRRSIASTVSSWNRCLSPQARAATRSMSSSSSGPS